MSSIGMSGSVTRWITSDDSLDARRLRSRVGGLLFVCGTVLDLITMVAGPDWRDLNHTLIFTLSAIAIIGGAILSATSVPISAIGWYAIITVCVLSTGFVQYQVDPGTSVGQSAGLIYIWVTVCAALYCQAAATAVQVVLAGVVSAAAFLISGTTPWIPQWLMLLGTCAAISAVVNRLATALRRSADTDPLTGVHTRRMLLSRLDQEIRVAGRNGTPLSVSMLDLDKFKALNDTFGHLAGDKALIACVAAWRGHLRPADALARLGGDEFFVVLPGIDATRAQAVATRLVDAVRSLDVGLACSAGITQFRDGDSVDSLLGRTDQAMYSGKATGGNTVTAS